MWEFFLALLIVYAIIHTITGIALIFSENSLEETYAENLLDFKDLNIFGEIVIMLVLYTLAPSLLIYDIACLTKALFTWHPAPKKKKIKKSQAQELQDQINELYRYQTKLDRRIVSLEEELKEIKNYICINDMTDNK